VIGSSIGPTHGFAIAGLLAHDGSLGQVWHVQKTVVYRAVRRLEHLSLITVSPKQPNRLGPEKAQLIPRHSAGVPGDARVPPLQMATGLMGQALALTRSANRCQSCGPKASTGPCGSLLSRTAISRAAVPTSTHCPPLFPE
jgi:hypothetical protein